MTVSGRNNEKCLYGRNIRESDIVVDSLQVIDCHNCYEIVAAKSCHNVLHSFHTVDCRDSSYIRFCT
jgi:predicted neutral ceramidase superfamily lipid hydrolase